MEDIIVEYLNKALYFEEVGFVEQALRLLDKVLETFESDRLEILLEKAKMEFRNGMEKEALLDFVIIYNTSENEEIYDIILEKYYLPNEEKLRDIYYGNMERLKTYSHYRNATDGKQKDIVPIWQDNEMLMYLNLNEKEFAVHKRVFKEIDEEKDQVLIVANELWMEDIVRFEESYRMSEVFMDEDLPIYFFYDKDYWVIFMQLYDLEKLIRKNRVVFLVGKLALYRYLKEDMVLIPSIYCQNGFEDIFKNVIDCIIEENEQEKEKNKNDIINYYTVSEKESLDRVIAQKPRILFLTSRFTTALQYHTRDCMLAAKRNGCDVELLIEPDGIHRIYERYEIERVAKFKPDVVFCVDHFRFRHLIFPKEVVWITWVQDPLPDIMDKSTPFKLGDKDFVMSHYTTWKKFNTIGYTERQLINAPIPANHHIYKPYQLNAGEKEKYSCDICLVCHGSDVDKHIAEVVQSFPSKWQEIIGVMYKTYQKYVYETGNIFYSEKAFVMYVEGFFRQNYSSFFTIEIIKYLAEDMYNYFNQRVFRQALVDWILDAGFTEIKLWGNGWTTEEKYKKYAMGSAENGETLSKIYQASKIVVGNNIVTTAAARAWEAMLSGGFYISNYIPEEEDAVDIRKIIEVGKDVIMFHSREDLVDKLHYYLEHEEERKKMAERGRRAALEKMTYDVLMKRVLEEVAERLDKNGTEL